VAPSVRARGTVGSGFRWRFRSRRGARCSGSDRWPSRTRTRLGARGLIGGDGLRFLTGCYRPRSSVGLPLTLSRERACRQGLGSGARLAPNNFGLCGLVLVVPMLGGLTLDYGRQVWFNVGVSPCGLARFGGQHIRGSNESAISG
jgi:hypothetical protein